MQILSFKVKMWAATSAIRVYIKRTARKAECSWIPGTEIPKALYASMYTYTNTHVLDSKFTRNYFFP